MTDPLVPPIDRHAGDSHTAVPEEDRAALIPTYIADLGELYAAEQENIAIALIARRPSAEVLLDDLYLRRLHRAMFDRVWRWAGRYRVRETNIGIDPMQITTEVRSLTANALAWVESSCYDEDGTIRFHHRMVQIHPFVNGNGRHGRIAADLLVTALGRPAFSWGQNLRVGTQELRARYIAAIRRMDRDSEDLSDLLHFARS